MKKKINTRNIKLKRFDLSKLTASTTVIIKMDGEFTLFGRLRKLYEALNEYIKPNVNYDLTFFEHNPVTVKDILGNVFGKVKVNKLYLTENEDIALDITIKTQRELNLKDNRIAFGHLSVINNKMEANINHVYFYILDIECDNYLNDIVEKHGVFNVKEHLSKDFKMVYAIKENIYIKG